MIYWNTNDKNTFRLQNSSLVSQRAPSEDLLSQAARLLQAAEGEQARMQRVAAMF